MSIILTPEQEEVGKDNFRAAVPAVTRRELMKGAAAGAMGMGAAWFGYEKLEGDPVRVAFIGTGDEGNVLLTEHPAQAMKIVALADLRPENLARAFKGDGNAARIGLNAKLGADAAKEIATYADHRALIADKDKLGLEAVVIAVPLSQHAPIAQECLDAGLHVLTEKLMAHNITQCKNLIRKAEKVGKLLAVGHQRHYSILYENANKLVQKGALGDIKFIRAQWHRNNSFPGSDSWQKGRQVAEAMKAGLTDAKAQEFGYDSVEELVNWRLYNETGGGLMAELGSHQMDAASIFLGKVHPIAVQGYGGRNFYGVKGVGSIDKQQDTREIDDHIYVTFEFPGPNHPETRAQKGQSTEGSDPNDKAIVTYSSINTNRFEPYGETVFGSRGTLIMKAEKEALLYKEEGRLSKGGGPDQRIWVVAGSGEGGGGVALEAYETTSGSAAPASTGTDWATSLSRGYTEEMEHFAYCIREDRPNSELRCNGRVAMADAIMALTANRAMARHERIEFRPEWFDVDSDATPEADYPLPGEESESATESA